MSLTPFEDSTAWAAAVPPVEEEDIVTNAIRKERVIREIIAAQGDLKTILARTRTVQSEADKLRGENQTLQMYIDNLTKQLARR